MRLIPFIVLMSVQLLAADKLFSLDEAKTNGMWETLQNYIEHNSIIADICVYEEEWIPPSKEFWKGRLIQWAVVTHAHCGTLGVGDRIEYTYYVEEIRAPIRKASRRSGVRFRTFFLEPEESDKMIDGLLKVDGDGHWGFTRVGDIFADLFALELKTNPKLKPKVTKPPPQRLVTSNDEKTHYPQYSPARFFWCGPASTAF